MGRSPRNEQNERQPQQSPQQQQQAQAPTPSQQFGRPAPAQPPTPPPAHAPAANSSQSATHATHTSSAPSPAATSSAPPRALSESEALARDIRDGLMSGFVGPTTVLNGEADFKGMLRVDGHLTGHVNSEKGTLIVSAGGRVDADIAVAAAKINGTVNGDIKATERIEFGRNARVRGNIQTPALVIEQGAIFEGNCRMASAPAEQPQGVSEKSASEANGERRATESSQANGRARAERREPAKSSDSAAEAPAAPANAKPEPAAVTSAAG
ncbi:MAG TPA: polymer-forming cytoskeletal protein [Pyrinomonadaceae bacterium]|nr:polymer-forming cytoskeletal protein [Pyrinomonadaceae bacterium]